MPTPHAADLLYVALLGIAWPLYDHFVDWPMFQRWLRDRRPDARLREYGMTLAKEWALVIAGVFLWSRAGRPWSAFGLHAPVGWRLWASAAAVLLLGAGYVSPAVKLARSAEARARIRKAFSSLEAVLPHSTTEFAWFLVVSLTAGFCEEFLFRGYFIWTLAPWLGWWGAAALGVPIFGLLHSYQGRKGIVRTASVGAVLTLVVAATRSLIPAMALHAVIDIGSGVVAWVAMKDAPAAAAGAASPTSDPGGVVQRDG